MVRRLASYGEQMAEIEGQSLHRFPDLTAIATIDPLVLRSQAFGYRADNVVRIAGELLFAEDDGEARPGTVGCAQLLAQLSVAK